MEQSILRDRVKAKVKTLANQGPQSNAGTKTPTPKKKKAKEDPTQAPTVAPQKPAPPPDTVEAYFDTLKGGYYIRNSLGEYQRADRDMLALELRHHGFFRGSQHDTGLSYLEAELLRIFKERSVHFAGPLGGYFPGRYDVFTSRLLITRGPTLMKPVEGKWPLFREFALQLLGDQARYFFGWIKVAIRSLRKGAPFDPGQMLAISGAPGCGKSFLQTLITPMLGGRVSKPYAYLCSKTNFNADIFEAEHALIGDEVPRTDQQSRRMLGQALNALVANKEQQIHGKNKQPIALTPFLRISMSLNDTPDALMSLPSMESNVKDKIILLRATPVKFPFPSKRFPDSRSYYQALLAELPHFLFHLRKWPIPESLQDQRYGVVSYQDPGLVSAVDELAPETKLLDMIDRHLLSDGFAEEVYGTAAEIEIQLRDKDKHGECNRLFHHSTSCGQMLSRLASNNGVRVTKKKGRANKSFYKIVPGI